MITESIGIPKKRIKEILKGFSGIRALVIGDVMLDVYVWGSASRISPEAPVMVVESDNETSVPGGATNVVNNIQALGGKAFMVGVIGYDSMGERLLTSLKNVNADVSGVIVDPSRPTTVKTRIIANNQQILRVDREINDKIDSGTILKLLSHIEYVMPEIDVVIFSDYNKGIIVPELTHSVIKLAKRHSKIITCNPKPPNISQMVGTNLVSVNQKEADMIAISSIKSLEALENAGTKIRGLTECDGLFITRGSKGVSVFSPDGATNVSAIPVEVYDVAGAGDTMLSAATLALACGASLVEAATIGNYAAGSVVRKVGVATTNVKEIEGML